MNSRSRPRSRPEVTPEVGRMLAVISGDMTRSEITKALGLKVEKHVRENFQQIGLSQKLVEMAIANKTKSCMQKYRHTDKCRNWLEENPK